ncbi:MAG: hypothetical protein GPJ54_19655 [Candidatus Heimdallarchaeota archaeon]|nr:hypothetical protein [Candidatus Heimdallarchaeota archaeon]
MRNKLILIILISLMLLNQPVRAQEDNMFNFELDMLVQTDNESRTRMSQYIQAVLAPLGIKVNLIPIDFYQLSAHLFEKSNHKWDLSIAAFNILPWDTYKNSRTDDYWGLSQYDTFIDDLLGYSNKTRQAFQKQNNGVSQDDVENLIQDFRQTFDLEERQQKSDTISRKFLDELLYFFPLVDNLEYRITPTSLKEFDPREGIFNSIYKGAYFLPDGNRNASTNELRLQLAGYLTFRNQRDYLSSYLIMFDDLGRPHPDFATQWELSDWLMENGTIIDNGKNKFWMRDDGYMVQMNETTLQSPIGQAIYDPYLITLKDWEFSYWLKQQPHRSTPSPEITTFRKYDFDFDYTNNSMTVYSPEPSIKDIDIINKVTLYPEGILNTTLTYVNESGTFTGTPKELAETGIDPLSTEEFQYLSNVPMITDPFIPTNSSFDFNWVESSWYFTDTLREKYHFPSELDSPGGDFILHAAGSEEPYFFAYNRTISRPNQKPTTLPIDTLKYTWRWLKGAEYFSELFKNGEIDSLNFSPSSQNYELLNSFIQDELVRVTKHSVPVSGQTLYFDLLNPHLQKYNVRRAISLVIDKSVLTQMLDGHIEEWNNPVWSYFSSYNPDIKLGHSYSEARDLMRAEGYSAQETNKFNAAVVSIPPSTITIAEEIITPVIFPYLFLTAFVVKKLKKRKQI